MSQNFIDEQKAAYFLLAESTEILTSCGVKFVLVGGWVPYLFHRHHYGHPGTFDVDVLLDTASLLDGTFSAAGKALLKKGYIRAAKNQFQAHKVLKVGEEDFLFHVDFLNEKNEDETINPISGDGKILSIYTPAMKAVFDYKQYRVSQDLPGVNFPSVITFIATKALAMASKKRTRDAFDVFISVLDEDSTKFKESWSGYLGDGLFKEANDTLRSAIHDGDALEKIAAVFAELKTTKVPSKEEILEKFSFLELPCAIRQSKQ